ncbi:2OG-Fe(II) oxygenase [Fodinicurvata sp. EGI_FJ10296]|uniref:2OG-Fe(II) oxygenase n=1 Tax=Fodinicurvata sp. EGI_FJ10296 TaxID=3231908 RepID=UPI003455B338
MMIRLDRLDETPLATDPFNYVVVKDFLTPEGLDAARKAYPEVPGPGSHPPDGLAIDGAFQSLIDELQGSAFRSAVERKFDIDLTDRPTMYTVRGYCRSRDGKIHTDSKTKLITVLLYMNDDGWPNASGRLRLLRNGTDLEDYADEVEPAGGTLLIFKRADNSWHGHHSYEGPRRAVQLNWVTDQSVVDREQGRHGFSSRIKKLFTFGARV